LLDETFGRIMQSGAKTAADIRHYKHPIAGFSDKMRGYDAEIKRFLFENMYRHYRLNRMTSKARRVVKALFQLFLNEPECLPASWRKLAGKPGHVTTAQAVADYLAGMTDRFAMDEHRHLFDLHSRSS